MEDYSMNALSYNTERNEMYIPEYGRNIQNMINYAKHLEAKEDRNLAANTIIGIMGQINPHLRDVEDYNHKLWTHLYVMSNFDIDVDCPYDIPKEEELRKPPEIMSYPKNKAKYGHFGYYTEKVIETVTEDEEGKEHITELLGNLLKRNYLLFHTHNIENKAIADRLKDLSAGKLILKDPNVLKSTKSILKQYESMNKKPKKKKSKRRRR